MPQLDYIIIFPQIFWFCVIFTVFYLFLTHIFLPKFLKALKSRKLILQKSNKESQELILKLNNKQIFLKGNLLTHLSKIKKKLLHFNTLITSLNYSKTYVDKKIAEVVYWHILYYDTTIVKQIQIFPKKFNLKFKK
uniref:ATP synthase F0 subunit 8 n=1 Tax=Antithamnionella miharai TaxID=536589 RepID=UPI002E765EA6|nr:ATP synthase F0 subunit 8 [Antithamnionella miharai]WQF69344.1 ATP synthase F0 subunit 8 [Antithamnionella miharai]WQF69369.1 ATP synthase F0 subunit 8 [Antithamnionella miharai]